MPALEDRGTLSSTYYVQSSSDAQSSLLSWLSTTITPSRLLSTPSKPAVNCEVDDDHPSCKGTESNAKAPGTATDHIPLRPKTRRFPTENSIFVFISDIGAPSMIRSLVSYGDRASIPRTHIRSVVKSALDDQWERLKFGKVIDSVIPFLPMESSQLGEVMRLKLNQMSKEFEDHWWLRMVVDNAVIDYLTLPQFIEYEMHKVVLRPKNGNASEAEDIVRSKQFVKYGGRALENGPLQALQAKINRYAKPQHVGKCSSPLVYNSSGWAEGMLMCVDSVFHVGILNKNNIEQSVPWGNRNFNLMQVHCICVMVMFSSPITMDCVW